jgi:hypothetical protein
MSAKPAMSRTLIIISLAIAAVGVRVGAPKVQ